MELAMGKRLPNPATVRPRFFMPSLRKPLTPCAHRYPPTSCALSVVIRLSSAVVPNPLLLPLIKISLSGKSLRTVTVLFKADAESVLSLEELSSNRLEEGSDTVTQSPWVKALPP